MSEIIETPVREEFAKWKEHPTTKWFFHEFNKMRKQFSEASALYPKSQEQTFSEASQRAGRIDAMTRVLDIGKDLKKFSDVSRDSES